MWVRRESRVTRIVRRRRIARSVSSRQCGGSKRALRLALARRDLVAARDHEAGVPSRRPPTAWRLDRLRIEARARDQPGDNRIRVPNLACAQLNASPHWRWHMRYERKQSARSLRVGARALRTLDRLGNIRDNPTAPEAHLIAEDSEPPHPTAADRSFGDNAAVSLVAGSYRRLLDYEPSLGYPHLERRVVEVAGGPPPEPRCHCLVEASVETNKEASGAERQPI